MAKIIIEIDDEQLIKLEGLVNRLTLLAEKLSGKGGSKNTPLKSGKKRLEEMNSREMKNHFKKKYHCSTSVTKKGGQ